MEPVRQRVSLAFLSSSGYEGRKGMTHPAHFSEMMISPTFIKEYSSAACVYPQKIQASLHDT
jgi:hypothetical protein